MKFEEVKEKPQGGVFLLRMIENLDAEQGVGVKFCEAYFKYGEQNFTNHDKAMR